MAAPAPGADSKESAADKKSPPKSPPSNFYGYLFDATKAPTRTLENLLRAIGKHIIAEIGDKNTETLTPPKLAAFYKAVGGNYDSLFVNVPYQSISFIWQFTGCQYSLQPVEGKDYEPPSIPALTLRGFVRWQSIEILLGPEEHVPFIQHAVKHWALKNPDTGEPFPTDLPKEAFPAATDPDIDKWHKSCAAKLKQQAEPASARRSFGDHPRPHSSERAEPKARMPYAHLRNPNSETPLNARPGPDYFARPVRAVPGRVPSQRVQVPLSPERTRFHPGSSSDERARRRSLSDHPSPQADGTHGFKHLHPERPAGPARRHSQPRHASSSDSISDSDDANPPMRHRPGSGPEDNGRRRPGSVRHVPAGGHSAPSGSSQSHLETRPHRADDPRKRSLPFTVPEVIRDKFDKVSAFVSNGRSPDRHRSASGRRDRERDREREIARRNREHLVASKLRGSWEDLDADASDGSDSSVQRHTRMKLRRAEKDAQMREDELRFRERERDRERERERERGRDRGRTRQDRERDWERERERDEELETRKRRDRERFLQRPEVHRRTSSHADIDRMREEAWDPRDRDFRDEKRRWKEREPAVSPVTGVSGRRYPAEPVWN